MKAKHTQQTSNKSTRQNQNAALASEEWYQEFVRHVELQNLAPRTRVSYLAWVRRLHEAMPKRDITALTEGECSIHHRPATRAGFEGLDDQSGRLLVCALVCGELDEPKPVLPEPPVPRCPHCGAEMKLLAVIRTRGPPLITP